MMMMMPNMIGVVGIIWIAPQKAVNVAVLGVSLLTSLSYLLTVMIGIVQAIVMVSEIGNIPQNHVLMRRRALGRMLDTVHNSGCRRAHKKKHRRDAERRDYRSKQMGAEHLHMREIAFR